MPTIRQRNVYPTDQIPHLWIHQTQTAARNPQGNLQYSGDELTSYRTVIGLRATSIDGAPVILLSEQTHSVTTAKQLRFTRRAIPAAMLHFTVPTLRADAAAHRENLAYFVTSANTAIGKSARARTYKQRYLDRARWAIASATAYATAFNLDFVPSEMDTAALEAAAQRIQAEERAASKAREAATQEANRERQATATRTIGEWMDGSVSDMVYWIHSYLQHDYLRVGYGNPTIVETSRGMTMDMETVQRFLPRVIKLAQHCVETQTACNPGFHIGNYTLDDITAAGLVTIGCHRFPLAELLRFQATLATETATA